MSFQALDKVVLRSFEVYVLQTIGFMVPTVSTPWMFTRNLIGLWNGCKTTKARLEETADALLCAYFEAHEVLEFAPFTVAISAIILSFSILLIDCSGWLATVPDFCLPHEQNPIFMDLRVDRRTVDIDLCLQKFETVALCNSHSCNAVNNSSETPTKCTKSVDEEPTSKTPTSIALRNL
jgi:hypothetical protein